MAHHNVELPQGIQYGSSFGVTFSTIIQQTASGHEVRVARQSAARHKFFPVKALQTSAEAMALKTFAMARRGSLHSFLLKDEQDNTSNADGVTAPTATDVAIGTGDGTETEFQLIKVYDAAGPAPYTRTITCPVAGSIVVAVAGTPTTAFTEANGVISLNAAPTVGQIVTAGYRYRVPVRFAKSVDEWAQLRADAYSVWSMPDMECVEVLDEVQYPEAWWPGGDTDWGQRTTDLRTNWRYGELQLIDARANISVFLPPPDNVPGGPRMFVFHSKATSTHTIQLRDDTGTAIGSAFSAGATKRVFLSVSGGSAVWGSY